MEKRRSVLILKMQSQQRHARSNNDTAGKFEMVPFLLSKNSAKKIRGELYGDLSQKQNILAMKQSQ
jgi:hypothetical protein